MNQTTQLFLGHVPWDNTYKHTRWFGSATEQSSEISAHMSLRASNYTFIRDGRAVRVPYARPDLDGFNYLMYENGGKWYYAFITGMEYLNNETTEVQFERDVFQTWMFDYDRTACFVEREHVSNDAVGANTIPEPPMALKHLPANDQDFVGNSAWVIVQTTQVPSYEGGRSVADGAISTDIVQGGMIWGEGQGCAYFAFNMAEDVGQTAYENFLRGVNEGGGAAGVVGVFMMPDRYMTSYILLPYTLPHPPSDDFGTFYHITSVNAGTASVSDTYTRPNSFFGYTPKNNKLFTSPYQYLEVRDYNGNASRLLYEDMADPAAFTAEFVSYCTMAVDATIVVDPVAFTDHESRFFTVPVGNLMSWVYDTYNNWIAQNRTTMLAAKTAAFGSSVVSALEMIPGVAAATQAYGQGQHFTTGARIGNAGAAFTEAGGLSAQGRLGASIGAMVTVDLANQKMLMQPNETKGDTGVSFLTGLGMLGFEVRTMQLRADVAQSVDDFFTMYGYEVDRLKVPEVTSRPSFNYVKTRNNPYNGNVPAPDMALVNRIWDAGITLWHTWDVGNYSLDNSL